MIAVIWYQIVSLQFIYARNKDENDVIFFFLLSFD